MSFDHQLGQTTPLQSKENVVEDVENKEKARKLVADAKILASEGELYQSLKYFKKAYKLFPSAKILNRIQRIEEVIAEDEGEEDEDFGFTELDNGLVIYKKLVERLYPHQINGVKWIFDLYKDKKRGGILADDMGLGKTIQVIAFISAMFDMKLIKHILLVLPLSVIPNWEQEFKKWAPGIRIECFHGAAAKRKAILRQCMTKRSVCITTYGLVVTQYQTLGETLHGGEFVWDYIILDEGHRIKNPSKTTKRLHLIPSRNRLILTGTPVQNKVRDLWALMDWTLQGSLLGTQRTFRSEYELPIERSRQKDASTGEIVLGNHMAESLRRLTDPYILRRTKAGVLMANKENKPLENKKKQVDDGQDMAVVQKQPSFPKLSTKNDFVVWVYLSEVQQMIYQDFIKLDRVKDLLTTHRSPLVYLTILKKICDHPRLLSRKACRELGLDSNNDSVSEDMNASGIEECAANRIDNIPDETLINESGKLEFLIQLLLHLRQEGHRTLVFSMSRKMLNIIQRILINKKFKVMRMDGLVTKTSEREKRVNKFQQDDSYHVFLLTTQVGGVGLTLTAADRVVIYDPSWNPATDAQAVDRIYRIGQKKRVMVYRLITCGAVEEKIYRRQVFKNSVIEQSTGQNKDPYRYFSRQELAELFVLDDVKSSATQQQLEGLHGHQRTFDDTLQRHVDNLHTFKMFGLSDHDLMFTRKPDDFDYEDEMATDLYNNKVEQAQNKLKVESDQLTGLEETDQRWGAFVGDRVKDDSPKFKDQEPVYPIEGISDKLEALSLPDYMKIKSEPTDFQQICNNKFSSSEFKKEEYQFQDIKLEGGGDVRADDNFNTEEEKLNQASVDEEDFESDFLPAFDFKKDKMESSTPQAMPPIGDIITLNDSNGSFTGGPSPFKTLEESWVEKTSASTSNLRLSDDDDDDVIICGDSPVRNESTIPAPARARSPDVNDTDEDAVILAADSPLPDEKLNDLSNEEDESRGFLINTVEDSIRLFSESDDNDDEEGDSWKDVFAVKDSTPNTSVGLSAPTTSNRLTLSRTEETSEDESADENSDGTELYSDEEYQDLVNSGAASFIFNISSDKEC